MPSTRTKYRRVLLVGGVVITAGLTGATSAFAAEGTVESGPVSASEQQDARAYWTAERMRNAKPMDRPVPAGKGGKPTSAPRGSGAPGFAGGTSAGQTTESSGPSGPVGSDSPEGADGAYPGPHTTWPWFGKYRRYPVSTMGKLFFTQNGGNFVCSGTVTYGGGAVKNTVWTAGHCVSDGTSTFNTSAVFCPSYDNGTNAAVGCWNAGGFATTTAWHNNGDFDRDHGMVFLNPGGNNNNQIVDQVGGLGMSWNFARDQHWMDFGYPSSSPWTGGKLVVTAAEHRYDRQAGGGPASNSIGSGHTPGSSGGGWVIGFHGGSGGYINSVNSHYYSGGANGNEYGKQMQGPYHDTFVCQIWDGWTGWPGSCPS